MPPSGPGERRRLFLTALMSFLSAVLIIPGCSGDTESSEPRHRFTLDELAIPVREPERSFFLSDRKGGVLLGRAGEKVPFAASWSVDGRTIVRAVEIFVGDTLIGGTMLRDAIVRPDRVTMEFSGGRAVWSPVEGLEGLTWGLALDVETDRDVGVSVRPAAGAGFREVDGEEGVSWQGETGGATLTLCGGPDARRSGCGLSFEKGRDHRALLLLTDGRTSGIRGAAIQARLPELMAHRTERMEGILERSYLRLSDSVMTKALAWARLSLDAMIVERAETLAVSSLPWDGSYEGRANLQSLAGIALLSGEYGTAASLLRGWGATQDRAKSPTFGRIASRLHGSPPEYRGVDVGAWFVRGLYDYIVATGDTASAGAMFPVVRRSIDGMRRNNVTRENLVVHRSDETWMGESRFIGSRGPYSAVEVQTLWQDQQMIGGFLAQLRGDTALAKEWFRGAVGTAAEFAKAFVDTGGNIVYDFLDGDRRGVDILRPNALLAIDGIEGERVRQALLKRSVRGLLHPGGPSQSAGGPVIPWLVGPFAYGLTRADRQDLAYQVSRSLAGSSLGRGMVGSISEREDDEGASLLGASEFLRAMVQDYLGVRVDVPSSVIRCEPKLPAEIRSADFTVYMGPHVVRGSYQRIGGTGRMNLSLSDVPRPVKWRFIWVLENGDAWIGAVRLQPGTSATVVFTPGGMLVYQEGEERKPEESWFVRGFARSEEAGELSLAPAIRDGGALQP